MIRRRVGAKKVRQPRTAIGALSVIVVAALLAACDRVPPAPPAPNDSWYRGLDNPAHKFYPLPPFLFSPVKAELVEEAVAALGDGPLLQPSTREAIRYSDDRLRTMQELRPFLIHGLYRSKRAFAVAIADRALWVDSADHHEDASPVTRQPLVIYIDEVPPDVYVTVGEAAKAAAAARHSDQ